MNKSTKLFRGSELPRLLLLMVILVFGLVFFWQYFYFHAAKLVEPELLAAGKPAPIQPDQSEEFEGVTDKTKIAFRDMAAYHKLLEQARKTKGVDLDKQARRDVLFSQLWDRPELYRGVPIHLLGTARRILRHPMKDKEKFPKGWIYEAYIFTPDSQNHPYCCVFEDVPEGMPIGDNISERVIFNGYFLKLMAYQADLPRAAPVLIGRIGWTAPAGGRANGGGGLGGGRPVFWMATAIAAMFLISLFRWITGLRRSLQPKTSLAEKLRTRPTEEIDPEALAHWVESAPHLEDAPEKDAGEERRP